MVLVPTVPYLFLKKTKLLKFESNFFSQECIFEQNSKYLMRNLGRPGIKVSTMDIQDSFLDC